METADGRRRHITGGDVLVNKLNWVLLHSPYQGLAHYQKHPFKEMTKQQKEFLFDYYMKRNQPEKANALYENK